jgi:hypothetical protein
MPVANGFGPAAFSIKFGPSFTDDLPSGKQFLVDLRRTGSSSPVAGELHEASFDRAEFVQDQSISAAAPAILCPTLFRPKYFYTLHCQPYDGLVLSSGQQMGSSGQQMGNIVVVHP